VAFLRRIDEPEPVGRGTGPHEQEHRVRGSGLVAVGTLACSRCDAPVAPEAGGASPADPISCPYCAHEARVRDFLSLSPPTRPARVAVRVTAVN
jgi:hypothetical protein